MCIDIRVQEMSLDSLLLCSRASEDKRGVGTLSYWEPRKFRQRGGGTNPHQYRDFLWP
jgi:hypothetical protein